MTAFTVVSVVDKGDFRILGILDGAYGLAGAADDISGEIFASVIDAENREAAEQMVRERYLPAPRQSGEPEPPC